MTESDDERDGMLERVRNAAAGVTGGDADATGADAVDEAPTDVAAAAGKTVDEPAAGSGGTGAGRRFGPAEGGLSDILPGGSPVNTDEDDTPTDRLNPDS